MFDFTLVCVDGGQTKEASKKIFNEMNALYKFKNSIFFDHPKTLSEYNKFIVHDLNSEIDDGHVLIIQYDGYIINKNAWSDSFFEYDYIGAPWLTQPWNKNKTVGNGGFSLRSKKFLECCSNLKYSDLQIPEDEFLCRMNGDYLENLGIKFAPISVAYDFSVEDLPYKNQFGFHGKRTIMINKQMGIFK
jgi:hypothetical protein